MDSAIVRQLCVRARQGSASARDQLIKAHMGLVAHVAKGFFRPGAFLEWDDLIQQGCLGLLRAIEKFDPHRKSKGKWVQFATYAHYWVSHSIRREIENHGRTVAVPVARLKPRKDGSAAYVTLPLDGEWFEDKEGTARARWMNFDLEANDWGRSWDARRAVEGLLTLLSGRQQEILRCRYGLSGAWEALTQHQTGRKLVISGPRVGVLERAALHQLRAAVNVCI